MTHTNNGSGAGVLRHIITLRTMIHIPEANETCMCAECRALRRSIATIESAMALPGKLRAEAADDERSTSLWDQGYAHGRKESADDIEAIFGPAPPATDAPDNRQAFERWVSKRHGGGTERWADTGKYRYDSTNAWWECWQEAQKVATPPASMNIAHRSVPETSGE